MIRSKEQVIELIANAYGFPDLRKIMLIMKDLGVMTKHESIVLASKHNDFDELQNALVEFVEDHAHLLEHMTLLNMLADTALKACHDYWKLYSAQEAMQGNHDTAVVWVQDNEKGHLMVFTRGEYSEELKHMIKNFRMR